MISLFTSASITLAGAQSWRSTAKIVVRWTSVSFDCRPKTINEFGNYNNREWVLFIVYADLECVLRKMKSDKEDASSAANVYRKLLCAMRVRRHVIVVSLPSRWWLLYSVVRATMIWRIAWKISYPPTCPTMSKQQWETYRSALSFARNRSPRMIHGSSIIVISPIDIAHLNCNLNYKNLFYIPIVFHNLSGYDMHFIIKEIATAYDGHVDLFSITKEKYWVVRKIRRCWRKIKTQKI